jgi:hypothetical protein
MKLRGFIMPLSTHTGELLTVFAGVVSAKKEDATGRHGCSNVCLCSTAIAAVKAG